MSAPVPENPTNPRPSLLDRSLRPFTEVRAGEGATALLLFANVLLILCAYYFVKPLREGWIAVSGLGSLSSTEVKAFSSFGQAILLLPVIGFYARLSDRVPRRRLITISTLFCMSNMVVFWALQPDFLFAHLPLSGIVFYLWVGMFGVFVVAQFWAFAADVYTDERGKRLMPMVAIGATSGAALGSFLTSTLLDGGYIQEHYLLLVAMIPLAISLILTSIVDRRESPTKAKKAQPGTEPLPSEKSGKTASEIIRASKMLLAVAVITPLFSWVNTNGENLLFWVLQNHVGAEAAAQGLSGTALLGFTSAETKLFYADFYFWVNVVALVLQAFVASRLLKYGGFASILLMMPVVALFSYAAMVALPILAVVRVMKIAENSTDYSINNTARQVLWLPLGPEEKYKAKPFIDTTLVRIGDGLAALTVLVLITILGLSMNLLFAINVALVVVWLGFAWVVVKEHRALSTAPSAGEGG